MAEQPTHLVVMGVSGSGKSTIAALLRERLGWDFAEADEFHPKANIRKMSQGTPLSDEDRWPWLRSMQEWMGRHAAAGESTIVTCSALKRKYRDLLREADGVVHFVHLDGDADLLEDRLEDRTGHFMPKSLLPDQLSTLEPLEPDESGIRVTVDRTPEEIVNETVERLGLA
jgi:gluconokinase